MKCPFKKFTYIHNTSFFDGYPQEQTMTEEFLKCEESECAMWNRSEKICGLPIIPSAPKISDDYEPGAGGFSLM